MDASFWHNVQIHSINEHESFSIAYKKKKEVI